MVNQGARAVRAGGRLLGLEVCGAWSMELMELQGCKAPGSKDWRAQIDRRPPSLEFCTSILSARSPCTRLGIGDWMQVSGSYILIESEPDASLVCKRAPAPPAAATERMEVKGRCRTMHGCPSTEATMRKPCAMQTC